MGDLYLCTRAHPDAVDIDLVGPMTSHTASHLRATLSRHRSIVSRLRLRGCTGIDPDGVLALLAAAAEAREAGGEVQLHDVPPLIEWYLHHHDGAHLLVRPPLLDDDTSTLAQEQGPADRSE